MISPERKHHLEIHATVGGIRDT